MNHLPKMPTPQLATEVALRWRLFEQRCDICDGPLYIHQAFGSLNLGYRRCPSCRINFIARDGIRHRDKFADSILDELAARLPIILRAGREWQPDIIPDADAPTPE